MNVKKIHKCLNMCKNNCFSMFSICKDLKNIIQKSVKSNYTSFFSIYKKITKYIPCRRMKRQMNNKGTKTMSVKTFWCFSCCTEHISTLILPTPCISEGYSKIKINLSFYFQTSLWYRKRFYEGL